MYAVRSGLFLKHSVFTFNRASESGGVVYILQSLPEVQFSGFCKLIHNSAGTGGAIYAIESTITLPGFKANNSLSIAFNIAKEQKTVEVVSISTGAYLPYTPSVI